VSVSEIDLQIGLETYVTKTVGICGAIRRAPEDFAVEEVLVDGSKATTKSLPEKPALDASQTRQRFLLCILVKRNWDTFIALRNVAKTLRIEPNRIAIAGIKDAKAITAQYVTIEGISAEEAAQVQYIDIQLHPIGYFHDALSSFYLLGNNFKINVTDIVFSEEIVRKRVAATTAELTSLGGIPNFYGHQRFGTTRAITHLVGKAMVQGNIEDAAMLFLAKPSEHEHPQSREVRAQLQSTHDFKVALQTFPTQLRFERVMLRHLSENPKDFLGAFRWLPLKLRMLFVQAWQSYLFNRFLSARLKAGFSLVKAEAGDFVVSVERSGLPMVKTGNVADLSNLAQVNELIKAGKMRVALPIFGARQRLSGGAMGDLEKKVLNEEGVVAGGFRVPLMPELSAKGELRAAVCPIKNFTTIVSENQACLEFMLLRGSYATVLLREIMKPKDLVAARF
jgi:tRNA pseudouridine13 synthase